MGIKKQSVIKSEEIVDGVTWLVVQRISNGKNSSKVLFLKSDVIYHESGRYKGQINRKAMVGKTISVIYDEKQFQIKIKKYISGERTNFIIDVVGYFEINYKIGCDKFFRGELRFLINNIYASPKAPEWSRYTREEMIEIIGEEVARRTTWGCKEKILITCPKCGKCQKEQIIRNIAKNGVSCDICGHGTSLPERFMKCCLDEADISYKHQFKLDGYNYKYDFYLPELKTILETNGIQHYTKKHKGKVTVEEQQEIDKMKKDVAINERIVSENNYFQIDNRKSEFKFLKEKNKEVFKSLGISLTDEQYKKAFKKAQKLICAEICKYFDDNYCTVPEIAKVFNTSKGIVRKYLQRGADVGLCRYNAKEEHKKASKKISEIKRDAFLNEKKFELEDIWNYKNKYSCNIREIAEVFNISTDTARNYVKLGKKMGKCEYNPEEGEKYRIQRLVEATRNQKGGKHPYAKKIRCVETGQVFGAISEAAEFYNIKRGKIDNFLRGRINHVYLNDGTKIHFEYVDQVE